MSPADAERNRLLQEGATRPPVPQAGDEAVFEVLGEFQSGVEALKVLYNQRTALKARLEQEEAEIRRKAELLVDGQRAILDMRQRVEVRRQRLHRVRDLVREETRKFRVASEALHSRIRQCDQILAQRIDLVHARESLEAARLKIDRARTRSRTAVTMLCAAVIALLLLGASWLVAGVFKPGTFVATALLVADGQGRDLTAADRAGWQTYHEQLLADPRFHEMGAERMLRRGIVTLGTPGAFADMMTRELNGISGADGELILELRGSGGERTARVLDTVATALTSYANANAQRRTDGAATVIKEPAKPGAHAIDGQREILAAQIWAVATGLFGTLSVLVWRRMVHDKTAFETLTRADELLDESRWGRPDDSAILPKARA